MTDLDIVATALADVFTHAYSGDAFMAETEAPTTLLCPVEVRPDDVRAWAHEFLDNLGERGLYLVAAQWDEQNECLG